MFGKLMKRKVSSDTMIGITPEGKKQVEFAKGSTYAILAGLDERSPQTINGLAEDKGLNVAEVKSRVERLARMGLLRVTSAEPEMPM